MKIRRSSVRVLGAVLGALVVASWCGTAGAWSHQGHILISRVAALRIIEDEGAPAGLRAFLKKQMPHTMEDCRRLVLEEYVGPKAEKYLEGLDGASTWPDRVQETAEGKEKKLEPYGMPEFKMHFLDLEFFGKEGEYKADLSGKPALEAVPRDPKDARYKQAGYVHFRVEESYRGLVKAFAGEGGKVDEKAALEQLGYLGHYMADVHQPHHSTADYKSLSYLAAAKVPGVREIRTKRGDGTEAVTYRTEKGINPHGDVEYQIFETTEEPRKALRGELWEKFVGALAAIDRQKMAAEAGKFDGFAWTLATLSESYQYLPLVGEAAAAAYKTGTFEPGVFFKHKGAVTTVAGVEREVTVLEMIASQKALAVFEVERAIRRAWAEGRGE